MFQYKCTIFREHKMLVLKPVIHNCYLQYCSVADTLRIWYSYVISIVHLSDAVNGLRWSKKCTERTNLK